MTTPVEKQNHAKFYEFHSEVGHNTDECMHLKKQIVEILKAEKLPHLIKELKQNNGKEQPKVVKKEETSRKDKANGRPDDHRGGKATVYTIGDEEHSALAWMNFMVVRSSSPYNGIIRRPRVRKLQAVPSIAHGMLKIPVEGGVITLKSSKLVSLECAVVSGPEGAPSATKPIIEERIKVAINPKYPEQTVIIGSTLTEEGRNKLCGLLQRNLDIFSWKPADMTGVPRHIAEHSLNVREGCSPVRQKKWGQAADKNQAIQEEVGKLMEAGIMKEVHCHDWLSNPVMVKKHDDNAYKGYHQIQMAKEDEEKTAFITSQGIFCYTKMPFGLRNAGATYQRLVDKAFHKQIGRNLEVYIDDLVIKSRTEDEIIRDIEETFKTLREINMKLNPKECTFGVKEGMFLGYKVNSKGLKVCLDKVDVVLSLPSPKCLKDVHKLNGKLASLNRFLAKLAEKSLPFFKTLKKCTKKSDFHWTTEAEEAFKQMKQLIAELPMLTTLMEKEELIVYLAATKETVSAVLMTEREAKQMPIYFVSRALRGTSNNSNHGPAYTADTVKTGSSRKDGSSCTDGSGAGLILTHPEGIEFTYALRFRFDVTNNKAEYEALIAGLRIAEQMGVKNLQVNVDSRLVANQVNRTYVVKESDMVRYLEKVKALTCGFKAFTIKQIPRSENKKADALSKIASTSFAHLSKQVLVEELKEKSISEVEVLTVVEEEGDTWMTPIYKYLAEETLPADMKKARAIKRKSWRFTIINGILYKKSFLGPWLRCVGPLQANYVLREIHEGSCSMHAGTRSVVAKALRTGYYWPTMHRDARTLIRACQDCQVHKPILRNPQQKLTPITSPWPFYKWGIDIAGPFPEGPGKVKFLIVAMDYFTKWIEAKPVATITGNQIKKFVWDNIVCRFGLPGEIISDNGKQFRDDPFKDWCEKLCINQHFASVKHPQTNGLVERANRSLGEGIKARLEARSKNWMEELPHVLWAHRTLIKSSNGDTPFLLTYETEAVIPAEIGMPTIRTTEVDLVQNNEALEINLDLLEERREEAAIREAKSKAKMEKYYNAKVRNTSFKPGDLVYRNNDASRAEDTWKLGPKWEGPYEVTEALGKGAYKLKDRDGKQLPRTWNISNLKKCYVHKM
ncbi:reverse transcriptase domain-containing protein [Tanacetum coccineum]